MIRANPWPILQSSNSVGLDQLVPARIDSFGLSMLLRRPACPNAWFLLRAGPGRERSASSDARRWSVFHLAIQTASQRDTTSKYCRDSLPHPRRRPPSCERTSNCVRPRCSNPPPQTGHAGSLDGVGICLGGRSSASFIIVSCSPPGST